jgi:hypothetical protein|tara:strand:+ start:504 stop:914 length:411 start_codon:yes stop_codon:yes gene_type:complete
MHHIIYISTAVTHFTDIELKELLVTSRNYNLKESITGVLFYNDRCFLQAIEGDEKNVRSLYTRIKNNKNHKGIITLFDEKIDSRKYPEWSMAYQDLSLTDLVIPKGYDNLLNRNFTESDLNNYSLKVRVFIKSFFP